MFKFTIRELVLMTTVVALAVGWLIEHQRAAVLFKENDILRARGQWLARAMEKDGWWVDIENLTIRGRGLEPRIPREPDVLRIAPTP